MVQERKPRFALKLQIVFDDGDSFMSGPVIDMSETGVFIETVMPMEPGRRVRLLPMLDDDNALLELEGIVMRKADWDIDEHYDRTPGMGVKFVDLTDEQRAQVRDLLERGRPKS